MARQSGLYQALNIANLNVGMEASADEAIQSVAVYAKEAPYMGASLWYEKHQFSDREMNRFRAGWEWMYRQYCREGVSYAAFEVYRNGEWKKLLEVERDDLVYSKGFLPSPMAPVGFEWEVNGQKVRKSFAYVTFENSYWFNFHSQLRYLRV